MAVVSGQGLHNLIYRPILHDRKSVLQQEEYQYREFRGLAFRYQVSQELQTHVLAPAKCEQFGRDTFRALYRRALTKFLYMPSALQLPPYQYLMQFQVRGG